MKRILCFIFIFIFGVIRSQVAERPSPPRLYNNLSQEYPDFLNSAEAAQLEEKLEQFSNQTSNQICVVVVDDFNGMDGADYAFKLGNEWGVGKKDADNGIVILIKPTNGNGGRFLEIATGHGLEGAIPDLATKRVREEMGPYLKQGAYYEALDKGTDALMKLAKGEIDKEDYVRGSSRDKKGFSIIGIIIFFVIIILWKLFGGGGGGGHTLSRAGRAIFWGSLFSGGLGGRSSGGGWGGSSSGGGGWGGFGGGSFGGGGSGGNW